MIKTYLTVAFTLSSLCLFPQSRFGIRTGLNLASQYVREGDYSATTKVAPRLHLTTYYDARISPGFSIQPGISLEGKGGKSKVEGADYYDKFIYIQVPVNFLGNVPTRSGEFFFGGGPYFAYGIDAKLTAGKQAMYLDWGSGPEQLNPFDLGLQAIVGYRLLNRLNFSISSSAGLMNISNQDTKYLNRVTSISVGCEFGRRNK